MINRKVFKLMVLLTIASPTVVLTGCPMFGCGPGPVGLSSNLKPILSTNFTEIQIPESDNSDSVKKEISEVLSFQEKRDPQTIGKIKFWDGDSVIRWNEIARDMVIKYKTNPAVASRLYSLLSVAQYDALETSTNNQASNPRMLPNEINPKIVPIVTNTSKSSFPSEYAAIAASSCEILAYLYPDEKKFFEMKAMENMESRLWAGVNLRSDIEAGKTIGMKIAQKIIEHAKTDGSDQAGKSVEIPKGEDKWFSSKVPAVTPLLPGWGKVKPWLVNSIEEISVNPPPEFGSEKFKKAIDELKAFSANRTEEQTNIAKFWADGSGTSTPPGHWNQIASDLIIKNKFSELQSALTFATMNMALMDAGICCWNTKYKYWLIRPSQADNSITMPIDLPNFPSYTSGHSSFSGAASTVLGYIFPSEKDSLDKMADEAGMSRIYAGIHYRFDSEEGLKNGRDIGNKAIEFAKNNLDSEYIKLMNL